MHWLDKEPARNRKIMIIKKSDGGKEVKIMVYGESKGIGKSTKTTKKE